MLFRVTFSIFAALKIIDKQNKLNQLNLNAMKTLINGIIEDAINAYKKQKNYDNPFYWLLNWYKHTIAPYLRGELEKVGFTVDTLINELTATYYV